MIVLKNIEKIYRTETVETIALHGIDLEIEEGEFVSIMGPSGCGKSTLLNIMGLLDEPSAGYVHIEGTRIDSYSDRSLATLRNHQIGFVFQSFHLIPDLNILDNVMLPLIYRKTSTKERRERARTALERVGLQSRLHHFPHQLSGGQQQRVAIARAIVGSPRILLTDEPTGNLDSQMGGEIMKILQSLKSDSGTTVVMVTHDEEKAEQTDRVVRIFDGRLVA
ncbi:ABC transporter ATP-binding protein [Sulfidibacter corallicola]|uniref:ABC transporter ATP-binding protein n=1 Tax=Sulfidibacter corallicola TaxID=2818388 RepID=A0A8A4TKX3_SULCO|nr:ABC transporter ATP-binding protein [Sulfidibacter corallicola]QTD49854.1 ABC transporter ATP-binding protein [Sulfidibacter corallicola]